MTKVPLTASSPDVQGSVTKDTNLSALSSPTIEACPRPVPIASFNLSRNVSKVSAPVIEKLTFFPSPWTNVIVCGVSKMKFPFESQNLSTSYSLVFRPAIHPIVLESVTVVFVTENFAASVLSMINAPVLIFSVASLKVPFSLSTWKNFRSMQLLSARATSTAKL